jgi:cytochrome c-type biogenesis protein CcmF
VALIGGNLDATWARWTRPTAAWIFLTLGIALGSGWAYYELGCSGWWFWDPVENASFMPCRRDRADPLAGCHRSAKQVGRAARDPRVLASLLGTFLVRPARSPRCTPSPPIRAAASSSSPSSLDRRSLAPMPGAQRRPRRPLARRARDPASATTRLVVACGAVLLGTLYPLALDALGMGKISVGLPYFDTVFVPLTPLVFSWYGSLARWKETER